MSTTLDKKRAAARIKPVVIEEHPWYRLFCVYDKLNIILRQVYDHDKGKMFVYEYTDDIGCTGHESTKKGTMLSMLESQITDELSKGIFKIVNQPENGNSQSIITDAEKAYTDGVLGESKTVHHGNSSTQQSSLFDS